jgi:hypothetical protein
MISRIQKGKIGEGCHYLVEPCFLDAGATNSGVPPDNFGSQGRENFEIMKSASDGAGLNLVAASLLLVSSIKGARPEVGASLQLSNEGEKSG